MQVEHGVVRIGIRDRVGTSGEHEMHQGENKCLLSLRHPPDRSVYAAISQAEHNQYAQKGVDFVHVGLFLFLCFYLSGWIVNVSE